MADGGRGEMWQLRSKVHKVHDTSPSCCTLRVRLLRKIARGLGRACCRPKLTKVDTIARFYPAFLVHSKARQFCRYGSRGQP